VILIVVILIVLGVHSCQLSARNSSLKDYNNSLASLIQSSDNTGAQFFGLLSAGTASDATTLQNRINEARVAADAQLSKAQGLDVPGEVRTAQQDLLLTLTMRRDGIAGVATQIQRALGPSTSADAVKRIAADMARFYASDVLYKNYVATGIAAALHAAGIPVGPNGEMIDPGQFLPDLGWLTPDFIASKLGASTPTPKGPIAPGTHGHSIDSVTVAGTTLQTGSTNTIPRSPPPTFTVKITNGGQNTETNVTVKVSVSGTNISGQAVIPTTNSGQSYTADVKLKSSPPAGTYTVNATVEAVPGEKNLSNNTLSFPVTVQ
jgi:hypothetical protein